MKNIHIRVIFSDSIQKRDKYATLLRLKARIKFEILIMRENTMSEKKISRHRPTKNTNNKNIIRCLILSIDERSSLTFEMCGISELLYLKMLNMLVEQGIAEPITNNTAIIDTTDLVIANYEKAEAYLKSNFRKSLELIEKVLVPALETTSSVFKVAAILTQ